MVEVMSRCEVLETSARAPAADVVPVPTAGLEVSLPGTSDWAAATVGTSTPAVGIGFWLDARSGNSPTSAETGSDSGSAAAGRRRESEGKARGSGGGSDTAETALMTGAARSRRMARPAVDGSRCTGAPGRDDTSGGCGSCGGEDATDAACTRAVGSGGPGSAEREGVARPSASATAGAANGSVSEVMTRCRNGGRP